ncbi:MAG: DUF3108 domain-containing protein [Nitrospinota bacterium]|nr:MAG: DUF3108 domain-containing protein [Nitrospinota bacterium]
MIARFFALTLLLTLSLGWGWVYPSVQREEGGVPFGPGERLRFQVTWLGIPAGEAEFQVVSQTVWKGKPVYHLVATVRSSQFLSLFYKIRDRLESYWDRTYLIPWYFSLRQREGRYRSYREVIFDHAQSQALYQKNRRPPRAIPVPNGVQDSLSSLYYLRTLPLQVGQRLTIPLWVGSGVKSVEVRVLRREALETRWGEIEAFVVQPLITEGEGIFRDKRDLLIWLSSDRRKLPLKVSMRIAIGHIEGTLVER